MNEDKPAIKSMTLWGALISSLGIIADALAASSGELSTLFAGAPWLPKALAAIGILTAIVGRVRQGDITGVVK